jgi:hypothetical protein
LTTNRLPAGIAREAAPVFLSSNAVLFVAVAPSDLFISLTSASPTCQFENITYAAIE